MPAPWGALGLALIASALLGSVWVVVCEPLPPSPPIVVLNESLLATWYDSTQVCMLTDRSLPSNFSFWQVLWGCETQLAALPANNGSKPWHRHNSGFLVLPSSAYSRKARDGCCNSDVHVRDRGFDWVWQGFEDGGAQRQCIELMTELSVHNKSLLFMGDSMNNQVFSALLEECHREGIRGSFDGSAKGSMSWVQSPESHGLNRKTINFVGAVYRLDWAAELRQEHAHYNNSVYIYVLDIWYGRRGVLEERMLMEVLVPLICRNHPSGLVILPNIGHHLESERHPNMFNLMVSTVSGFLDWMHELTKINWGRNLVAFRETTPSHFDSPDLDGSFEKWRGAGRSNYDYMANNPWDGGEGSTKSLYHCRSINTTAGPETKNTLENLVVVDILKTWGHKRSALLVLPVFKYLAPFYRLKYGFCGGYDRLPVLDCVHFCAWGPTMWIPIWDELLKMVRNFTATHSDEEKGAIGYEPTFGKLKLEDVVILRRRGGGEGAVGGDGGGEDLFLYYHGVRHHAASWHDIEDELGLARNSTSFPPTRNVTTEELSKILQGTPVEQFPILKDGLAIQMHGDNQIYYLMNGTKHAVPNWDTFCSLGFTRGAIVHISSPVMDRIKEGAAMPPHDWPTSC